MPNYDVVIVGSGIAALTAAYQLSRDKNVIIFTKSTTQNSNSMLAQGGVAVSISKDDTWQSHFLDTMIAGCHHNRENVVELLVKYGVTYISNLISDGMKFDIDERHELLLGKEGAHSTRRILHAGGDSTGRELVLHMLEKLKNRVKIIEKEFAIDLLLNDNRCVGIQTKSANGDNHYVYANQVILATGGCGGLYSFTSNDGSITGDGLAMAYRAGVDLTDLEFIQFHPTLLYVDGKGVGLVSEAVRGEGAILVTKNGRPIMKGIHPLQDLAPRDVVARTIYSEILMGEEVFLDISMIHQFREHFPTITMLCEKHGIQIESGLLPIIPGAHFLMGGIKTDERGRTSLEGLYAIGEVACTGVHGANRLASNSLLEGIVFGNLVAEDILFKQKTRNAATYHIKTSINKQLYLDLPTKQEIQQIMMEKVGIVRNEEKLQQAVTYFENYLDQLNNIQLTYLAKNQIEIVNMLTVGWLIASSALERIESRGGHYREDFPNEEHEWYKKEIIRNSSHKQEVYL